MIADLLAGLSEEEIQAIGEGSNTLELEANSRIFAPGDAAQSLFIVYNGEVEIRPEGLPSGSNGVLLGPGEFFGEIALIEGHSHTSTAITTQSTSLLELRWETLERIMDVNSKLLQNLNKALAERLRQTDKRLIKALTQLAGENARLYNRASAALTVSKEVGDLLDWSELWKRILDKAIDIVKADRGTVYMLNPANNNLESMTIRGEGLTKIVLLRGQGLAGACAQLDAGILVTDAQTDSRFFPKFDAMTGYSTRSVICAPFHDNSGKLLGVIQLIHSAPGQFNPEDLNCIALFADQLAIGFERSNSVRQIVSQTESRLISEIIGGIKESLPSGDESQNTQTAAFLKRIDIAHRTDIELTLKPIRFRTFLEKIVQEAQSSIEGINISINRESFYDGFFTADPDLLSAVLGGLINEIAKEPENPILITGRDRNDWLSILIQCGKFPNTATNRQPLTFLAANRLAGLHKGHFQTGNNPAGDYFIEMQLPLSG